MYGTNDQRQKILTFWKKEDPPSIPSPKCDPQQLPESFGNSRYFIDRVNSKPWSDAQAICKTMNAHLLEIKDDAEFDFIWRTAQQSGANRLAFHIGLFKAPGDGLPRYQGWKWVSTGEVLQHEKYWLVWHGREPNNLHRERCGDLVYEHKKFWNGPCNYRRPFICECNEV